MPPFVVIRVAVFCTLFYVPVTVTRNSNVATTRNYYVVSFSDFLAVPLHRIQELDLRIFRLCSLLNKKQNEKDHESSKVR